jgi:hypothetical protein
MVLCSVAAQARKNAPAAPGNRTCVAIRKEGLARILPWTQRSVASMSDPSKIPLLEKFVSLELVDDHAVATLAGLDGTKFHIPLAQSAAAELSGHLRAWTMMIAQGHKPAKIH